MRVIDAPAPDTIRGLYDFRDSLSKVHRLRIKSGAGTLLVYGYLAP